jgi:uncharacterized protein (TIGR03437 family)
VYSAALSQFWSTKVGLPLKNLCCDPQLEYDHASGRWIALSIGGVGGPDSALYLGISDTADASGGWKGLVIDADSTDLRWVDLPNLGLDGAAVYIDAGLPGIAATTQFRYGLWVLPKVDLIGGVPTAARVSRFETSYPPVPNEFYCCGDPQIDYMGNATDGLQIHASDVPWWTDSGGWTVNAIYQRMNGQASGAASLLPWAESPMYEFFTPSNPSPQSFPSDWGRQPGTSVRLNNGTGRNNVRVGDAVYSVGPAPFLGRFGIAWRRFQPSTNRIVDAGLIGDGVNDHFVPSIAANANGDVVIAYTRVSATSFASLYYSAGRVDATGKLAFDPAVLVKAGSNIYDENGPVKSAGIARFVDYASSVSVHPQDQSRFWISGPYVSDRNIGSTWVAEVIFGDKTLHLPDEAAVNGAAFVVGPLAPDSWVALFGQNLARELVNATEGPLPSSLGGTQVTVTDALGIERLARLSFVAPGQLNFLMPSDTAPGEATVTVTNADGQNASTVVQVALVAPGIFSANASGVGPAAATYLVVESDGTRLEGLTFDPNQPAGSRTNVPIDLGPPDREVYLSFFGTGFRFQSFADVEIGGVDVDILGAVAQGQFVGLDQAVVGPLPQTLSGRGEVQVRFNFDGLQANTVTVNIE